MSDSPMLTRSMDVRTLRVRRQFLLMFLAYLPPVPNTLRGLAGVKETLLILLTHATPLWVYRLVIQQEARLHRIFVFLREKGLF